MNNHTNLHTSIDNDAIPIKIDAVITGAGFAGMYMLYKLRNLGLSACIIEAGKNVGGTWYWNRYPAARCDVWSMEYSYQFSEELQQEWEWTEKYATQPEILRYANHVADRFDLRKDIYFGNRVHSAIFNDDSNNWSIKTDSGLEFLATFCIMATGCLSSVNQPHFQGIDNFKGEIYHTGNWPHHSVNLSDKRVGVIGTGSSAIQTIPEIAKSVKNLLVFQRTANYTIPAHNEFFTPDFIKEIKSDYKGLRERGKMSRGGTAILELNEVNAVDVTPEIREKEFEKRWQAGGVSFMGAFQDLVVNPDSNKTAADFVRKKIQQIVIDPDIAALLSPKNIIGCKRLCVDTNYYETFNRENVKLIDVSSDQIEMITHDGIKVSGNIYALDVIIFATGFDAMTGALLSIDIKGKNNRSLSEKWINGPKTYLGLQTEGFPNLFTITGPGSPSVLSNMMVSIEQHVEWISDCISFMDREGYTSIEPEMDSEDKWVNHVNDIAGKSLRSTCSSWYVGANIDGKPQVFMPYIGGVPTYREICEKIVANQYEGFILTK